MSSVFVLAAPESSARSVALTMGQNEVQLPPLIRKEQKSKDQNKLNLFFRGGIVRDYTNVLSHRYIYRTSDLHVVF